MSVTSVSGALVISPLETDLRMPDLQVAEVPSFSCPILTTFSLNALTIYARGLCQLLVCLLKKSSGSGMVLILLAQVPDVGRRMSAHVGVLKIVLN